MKEKLIGIAFVVFISPFIAMFIVCTAWMWWYVVKTLGKIAVQILP